MRRYDRLFVPRNDGRLLQRNARNRARERGRLDRGAGAELGRKRDSRERPPASADPQAPTRPPRRGRRGSRRQATRAMPTAGSASAAPSRSGRAPRSTFQRAIDGAYQMRARRASRSRCGSKPSRGSKRLPFWSFALRIRSTRKVRSPSRVRSYVWTYQYGSRRSIDVRLDEPRRTDVLALLQVLELDQPVVADPGRSASTRATPRAALDRRLGRLLELEAAERLLELVPHALERRVRVRPRPSGRRGRARAGSPSPRAARAAGGERNSSP